MATPKIKTHLVLLVATFASLLVLSLPVSAATTKTTSSSSKTTNENITQAVTQSYNADSSVQLGMIVQLKPGDASSVSPLAEASIKNMLGITVEANDATVTLTPQNSNQQQVYVATQGRYNALVSNQNGPIKTGDYITISSLAGVGMKADDNEAVVLGKATSNFSGTANVKGSVSLKDSQGKTVQVSIGSIPIDLNISHNPLASKSTDYVPSFLAKAAVTIASRPVSAARIYLSLVVLLISAGVTANIVYSGVRAGMQAIGRNPLSKKSIIRSLIQTVIAGLIIFIVGVFAVYLLLKL